MFLAGFLDDDKQIQGRIINGQLIYDPNELEYLIMHDIKMIREQSIYFDSQLKKRNSNISSNDILKIDKNIR